jgi:hypothetical protein
LVHSQIQVTKEREEDAGRAVMRMSVDGSDGKV